MDNPTALEQSYRNGYADGKKESGATIQSLLESVRRLTREVERLREEIKKFRGGEI